MPYTYSVLIVMVLLFSIRVNYVISGLDLQRAKYIFNFNHVSFPRSRFIIVPIILLRYGFYFLSNLRFSFVALSTNFLILHKTYLHCTYILSNNINKNTEI